MWHHYLKHSVGLLGMPLTIAALMVVLALIYQLHGSTRAACRWYLAAGLLTYFASTRLLGDALLAPLEARYAALAC